MAQKGRRIIAAVLVTLLAVVVTACSSSSSKSYTFNVETGDVIKVTLDTSNGLDLSQSDGQFTVTDKNGDNVLSGLFVTADQFAQQKTIVEEDSDADITENTSTSIVWNYNGSSGTEHDRMFMVTDSTGIVIGSLADQDEADAAYKALSFEDAG